MAFEHTSRDVMEGLCCKIKESEMDEAGGEEITYGAKEAPKKGSIHRPDITYIVRDGI